MKKFLMVGAVMMFLFSMGPVSGAGAEKVKIGYLPLVMSLPTFVAAEKGFFAQEGLDVELVPFQSGTTIIDALVAGRIKADCGSAISGHWFAEQNVPGKFKIFLVYGPDNPIDHTFVVVVKKDAAAKGIKDLKGKRVGHFPGATSRALAKAVIRTQLNPDTVTFVEIPPPNMVPALAAGQVDAFFTPEPLGMIAVSKGIGRYLVPHPVSVLNLERGYPGGAFSISGAFLKDHPEEASKIRVAIEKGVDFIRQNEKEARGFLGKYTRLPPPVATGIPLDKWIKVRELDKRAGQDYFQVLYKEGAYKKEMDTTNLYWE